MNTIHFGYVEGESKGDVLNMGAINGKEFINRLDQMDVEIWFDGKKLKELKSKHPAFKGLVQTKASLYDFQLHPEMKEKMTYQSPKTKESVGISFLEPKTKEDLIKRRRMYEHWARLTGGMLGRSPDYMNTVLMSFATSSNLLKNQENCFPENIQYVYELAREKDLSFTHTFVTPQVNRSQGYLGDSNEPISAKIIDKNSKGIIIKGARLLATQGGLSDEILVFSAPKFFFDMDEAFAFSIPSDTKGLKFICRQSFVGGDSTFDHPLSSRFEEMDSILVFDNVLVPWDRVFFYNSVEASNSFIINSSFQPFATHQVVTRQIVKTEFMLGVAQLLVDTINVAEYPHIQDKISEILIGLETMKALLEKSENDAKINDWGYMCPDEKPLRVVNNIFPRIYPRFSEIIQNIGASGLVTIPTEASFQSEIKADLDKYLQGTDINAWDKVKIFRLAWDLTMSSFGTRQTQYERYFFGDPVRLVKILYNSYPKNEHVDFICDFLKIHRDM